MTGEGIMVMDADLQDRAEPCRFSPRSARRLRDRLVLLLERGSETPFERWTAALRYARVVRWLVGR